MNTDASSSPWVRNSAVFDRSGAVTNYVINFVYFMVAMAAFILIQSSYINWGRSYHNVRLCAEVSALGTLLAAVAFIINMTNKPHNPVKSAVLYDLLYNGVFNLLVQLCDNYLFFMSLNAVSKISPWTKKLIHLYIWFVLSFCWICNYTLSPFFVDVNTDAYLAASGPVIIYCSGWGTVMYNLFFTLHFARYVWKTNKLAAWALRVDTVVRKRVISLKCIGHFFTSCAASLFYAYYPVNIGLPIYYIVITAGIHFWFNFKMEKYICPGIGAKKTPGEAQAGNNAAVHSILDDHSAKLSLGGSSKRSGKRGGGVVMPVIEEDKVLTIVAPAPSHLPRGGLRASFIKSASSVLPGGFTAKDSSDFQTLPRAAGDGIRGTGAGAGGKIDDDENRSEKVSLVLAAKDAEEKLEDGGFVTDDPILTTVAPMSGETRRTSAAVPKDSSEFIFRMLLNSAANNKVVGSPFSDGSGGQTSVVTPRQLSAKRLADGENDKQEVQPTTLKRPHSAGLTVSGKSSSFRGQGQGQGLRRVDMDRELAQLPKKVPAAVAGGVDVLRSRSNSTSSNALDRLATFSKIQSLPDMSAQVRVEDVLKGSQCQGIVKGGGDQLIRAATLTGSTDTRKSQS